MVSPQKEKNKKGSGRTHLPWFHCRRKKLDSALRAVLVASNHDVHIIRLQLTHQIQSLKSCAIIRMTLSLQFFCTFFSHKDGCFVTLLRELSKSEIHECASDPRHWLLFLYKSLQIINWHTLFFSHNGTK